MKKLLTVLILSVVCVFCAVGFSACDNNSADKNTNTQEQVGDNTKAELVSAEGFTMEESGGKITVSKDTETFSFLNKITVSDNATWVISQDEYGGNTFATKTAPLYQGDNTFYLIVTSGDGKTINVYNMTVRRIPVYRVSFNSGTSEYFYYYLDGDIAPQYIEEGYCATEPTEIPEKLGCNFAGWDFDFTTPITNYTIINAKWEVKPEMTNFEFTATSTTCTVTGLKDKTVTEITIPDSVTHLRDRAFSGCSSLTSVTIGNSLTSIGNSAFSDCTSLTSVTIGNSVTSIGDGAFSGCGNLTSIVIPDGVTSIGNSAFSGCPIEIATIPAFARSYIKNNNLKTVEITSGNIGDYEFYYCSSLTSITIGNSVTSIGYQAFAYCSGLTSVTIGNCVTSIGSSAFSDCSGLTSVYYKGTVKEWNDISINGGSGNNPLRNATRYYYSETAPIDTDYNYWHYDVDGVTPVIWVKED